MSEVIAVYGGSFDPPHVAHRLVAAHVVAAHGVDRLLVVPSGQHPFDKPLSPFEHRLRMCELAMADLDRVQVSPIERELAGPSLTLHTLEELARRHPGTRLRLVIGSDLLGETPGWHEFDKIKALAPPIVVARPGHPLPDQAGHDQAALPDVSSSVIRERLRKQLPTEGMLDPAVARYAIEHALYVQEH